MIPIPPEVLKDMGLEAGEDVLLSYEAGVMRMEPSVPRPSPDAVEFMSRFVEEYDEAMRNLSER